MSETEANLLEEALNSVKEVKVGDVVKGEVLTVDESNEVIVGIENTGVEGVVPVRELSVNADKVPDTGNIAVGHVRYSTTGKSNRTNAQPLVIRHVKGPMTIAHNGNLINAHELREKYELKGNRCCLWRYIPR